MRFKFHGNIPGVYKSVNVPWASIQHYFFMLLCLVDQLCPTLCDSMDRSPPGSPVHGDSTGNNTGVGCHALLQRIFPTQGSNPGFPHCRWILYCLVTREVAHKLDKMFSPWCHTQSPRTGLGKDFFLTTLSMAKTVTRPPPHQAVGSLGLNCEAPRLQEGRVHSPYSLWERGLPTP